MPGRSGGFSIGQRTFWQTTEAQVAFDEWRYGAPKKKAVGQYRELLSLIERSGFYDFVIPGAGHKVALAMPAQRAIQLLGTCRKSLEILESRRDWALFMRMVSASVAPQFLRRIYSRSSRWNQSIFRPRALLPMLGPLRKWEHGEILSDEDVEKFFRMVSEAKEYSGG